MHSSGAFSHYVIWCSPGGQGDMETADRESLL